MTIQEDINRTLEESVTLPPGWYCSSVSVSGVGVYEKTYSPSKGRWKQRYKVSFNGFAGGWIAMSGYVWDVSDQLFPGQVFPEYIGAILAIEIMLADAGS